MMPLKLILAKSATVKIGIGVLISVPTSMVIVGLLQTFPHGIEPWHVFVTLLISVFSLFGIIFRLIKTANAFRANVLGELRVTRVSIKELLSDLSKRNPEAMGRIVAAMDDKTVIDFVRNQRKD